MALKEASMDEAAREHDDEVHAATARDGGDATDLLIEEVSIDGLCGVY
jgi:mycofactocin precursor